MYVCVCFAVSDKQISDMVAKGAKSYKDIKKLCKAGSDCGACIKTIKSLIKKPSNG